MNNKVLETMKNNKRNKLSDEEYAVAKEGATEAPFSGIYNDEKRAGIYHAIMNFLILKRSMIVGQVGQHFTRLSKNQASLIRKITLMVWLEQK